MQSLLISIPQKEKVLLISIFYCQALLLHCNAICVWSHSQSTASQYCNFRQILVSACEQPHQVSYGYLLFLVYCRLALYVVSVLHIYLMCN